MVEVWWFDDTEHLPATPLYTWWSFHPLRSSKDSSPLGYYTILSLLTRHLLHLSVEQMVGNRALRSCVSVIVNCSLIANLTLICIGITLILFEPSKENRLLFSVILIQRVTPFTHHFIPRLTLSFSYLSPLYRQTSPPYLLIHAVYSLLTSHPRKTSAFRE